MARGGGGVGWAAQNHHRPGQPLPRPGPRSDLAGVRMGSQPVACRPARAPMGAPRGRWLAHTRLFGAPRTAVSGAFRGRGRLLAGARVPPEPSRRGLLVCYMLARRARPSVGRGCPRAVNARVRFYTCVSLRHRSKPTSRTCRRDQRGPWPPAAKKTQNRCDQRVPRGPNPGEDHHTPAARREGKAYGSPGRRRGKPEPTATPTRAADPELSTPVCPRTRRAPTHNYHGRRRLQVRHHPAARRGAPS